MANSTLENKLREAACIGDREAVESLIAQNVNINSKHPINGWTALHWAAKRGNEDIVRILLNNGADAKAETEKGEKPIDLCAHGNVANLFGGEMTAPNNSYFTDDTKFVPNYIRNAPLNGHVDLGTRLRLPTTNLPSQTDDLVVKVRIAGSCDPDFIEIELPRWKLTYNTLMNVCCEELEIAEAQVERIRKLPNTRLRKDNDVKRLNDLQCLEVVLKGPGLEKLNNAYQSISTRDQTILY